MSRDALIAHQYFGPTARASYVTTGLSHDEAHRLIGANVLAGFAPVAYTRAPSGEQLRSRDGHPLTVVALHGSVGIRGLLEIEQI